MTRGPYLTSRSGRGGSLRSMPRLFRTTAGFAVGAVCAMLALYPATAGAQDVMVDPDSPAGTEYAIPIDSARDQGSGGSGEIFGEGIESGSGSSQTGESGAAGSDDGGSEGSGGESATTTATDASGQPVAGGPSQLTAQNSDDSAGSRGLVMVLLATLLILAGAAFGGMRMRRSGRDGG